MGGIDQPLTFEDLTVNRFKVDPRFIVHHGINEETTTVEMPLLFYQDIRRQLREALEKLEAKESP